MAEAELDTNLRTWGNSYGIVIPVAVARQLNLKPGAKVHVRLSHDLPRNDASRLTTYDFPVDFDIDEILEKELADEYL